MSRPLLGSFGSRSVRAVLAVVLLAWAPVGAGAQSPGPLAPEAVPEPLRPWTDWVLRGHETSRCPARVVPGTAGAVECVWPARLELALGEEGARFRQEVWVAIDSEMPLPGADGRPPTWPARVRVDGQPTAIHARGGTPVVSLRRGRHEITGSIPWREMPVALQIPPATGLVSARGPDGERLELRREAGGRLWLRSGETLSPTAARDTLEVEVFRRAEDGIPLTLETRIALRVSGTAREVLLGVALPEGFVPTHLEGGLPARLEPDGRLRVQVRPGAFQLRLLARDTARTERLRVPTQAEGGVWDATEEWVFASRPELRSVELEDGVAIDPGQTRLPAEWQRLPAFRLGKGETLRLVERERGRDRGADRLEIARTIHLDFSGDGATVSDRIHGEIVGATRLEMGAAAMLGRVSVGGLDQPITRVEGSEDRGVEVPLGPLELSADSRIEGSIARLAAVGWAHDFDAAGITLALPPGWRLFHAGGVDSVYTSWVGRWTLLDVFLVMVAIIASARLLGRRAGGVAALALVLSWPEPGAPHTLWLVLLGVEALRRVAPAGRLSQALGIARAGALVGLLVVGIPFAVEQVRSGWFPALESPRTGWGPGYDGADLGTAEADPSGSGIEEIVVTSSKSESSVLDIPTAIEGFSGGDIAAERSVRPSSGVPRAPAPRREIASKYAPDPRATVATGPGLPEWRWSETALHWSGPVDADHRVRLWLVPPWANGFLAMLRVAAVMAFAWLLFAGATKGAGPERLRRWFSGGDASAAVAVLAAGFAALVAGTGSAARAEVPPDATLDELRARLLAPEPCEPECAGIALLGIGVDEDRAVFSVEIEAVTEAAIPLPGGGANGLAILAVELDGAAADALLRTPDDSVWLRVPKGRHVARVVARIPNRAAVEIPLPMRPRRVERTKVPAGWKIVGLHEDGGVDAALQLVRESAAGERDGLEPTEIPAFVRVERTLEFGLQWAVHTTVHRFAPAEGAVVVEVPLLPGESVTTPGLEVANGRVRIALHPAQGSAGWSSILEPAANLVLTAAEGSAWTEIWRIDPSPIWHVTAEGFPPVAFTAGSRLQEWQPWPGETLALTVQRPAGTGGETFTVDRSTLTFSPGRRSTDAELEFVVRSSQAGRHSITLPEGAELTSLLTDGRPNPLRSEAGVVAFPVRPGSQTVKVGWREDRGIALLTRAPAVDLGVPSVNGHSNVAVPEGRWLLALGGPRLGPVLLFWPILAVWLVLAWGLSRLEGLPLRTRHWIGLAIGFTQASVWAAGLFVGWLLALAWRRRAGEAGALGASAWRFDLLQVGLVVLTVAALVSLLTAIETGLLGAPEMEIRGNGSDGRMLYWYADRAEGPIPVPWIFSVPLWVYRLAMLAWSLWIAQALLGWLRFGWDALGTGGLWRPLRSPKPSPASD